MSSEEFIKNDIQRYIFMQRFILKDATLSILLNKKEMEKLYFCLIEVDSNFLQYIENPTKEMQLKAVKNNGATIRYIKNPTKEMQLEAVKSNGLAIGYIKNPTEEMKWFAIKQDGCSIEDIKNPTKEMQI